MGSNRVRKQQRQEAKSSKVYEKVHTETVKQKYGFNGTRENYGYKSFNLSPAQKSCIEVIENNTITFIEALAGAGKSLCALHYAATEYLNDSTKRIIVVRTPMEATVHDKVGFLPSPQPLWSGVLTKNGWVKLKDIKIGDKVIGSDGKEKKVTALHPQGVKEVFKLTTSSGQTMYCSETHQFLVKNFNDRKHNKDYQLKTLKEIENSLKTKDDKYNWSLPRVKSVEFNSKFILKIPPYVLGAFLGDGCYSDIVSISSVDLEIIDNIKNLIKPLGLELTKSGDIIYTFKDATRLSNKVANPVILEDTISNEKIIYDTIGLASKSLNIKSSTIYSRIQSKNSFDGYNYTFGENPNKNSNKMKIYLDELGLTRKKAWEKFIPKGYLFAPIKDRIQLLQGLLDTDGCSSKGGITYTTTSEQLANDVAHLVRSLGGKANVVFKKCQGVKGGIVNGVQIVSKRDKYIVYISFEDKSLKPFYLQRKNDNLYDSRVYSDFIVNVEKYSEEEVMCITIDSEDHLYVTDDYILTHNCLTDKLEPHFASSKMLLESLLSPGKVEADLGGKHQRIQFLIPNFILGATIDNAILIIDEAQTLHPMIMKLLLERIGENTKCIVLGDPSQVYSSSKDRQGMRDAIHRFFNMDGNTVKNPIFENIGYFKFDIEHCMRSDIVKSVLKAYSKDFNSK